MRLKKIPKKIDKKTNKHNGDVRPPKPRDNRPKMLPDINRSKLARDTGASRIRISLILSGKGMPGLELAKKMSVAMGMSMEKLLDTLKSIQQVSK